MNCPNGMVLAGLLCALMTLCCTPTPSGPPAPHLRAESAADATTAHSMAAAAAQLRDAADGSDGATAQRLEEASVSSLRTEVGPYETPFLGKRNVFFVLPRKTSGPQRLIANLHGVCNPPGYACGYWVESASEQGLLVCPTGDGSCGPGAYNAPTWTESYDKMNEDLELAIETLLKQYPAIASRQGSILTGFSKGAYAAVQIALKHPHVWPYLILNEADVTLSARSLREAGVRAVALIAGERGSQLPGERRTAQALSAQGYPIRLWVMPGAGHHYSADIDQIMREAMQFVLGQGSESIDGGATEPARL